MAKYDPNQMETDFAAGDPAAGGADDFGFDLEKQPANRGAIVLLFLLLLGGGGLYFLYNNSSFASGNAPIASSSAETAGASDTLKKIREGLSETRRTVAIFEQISNRPYVPVSSLRQNPFAAVQVTPPTIITETGKPQEDDRTRLLAAIMSEFGKLQLTAVMDMGEGSTCTINKKMVRVGQTIRAEGGTTDFTFVRIESREVQEKTPAGELVAATKTFVVLAAHDHEFLLTKK
jgi:hypothetical protein